MIITAIKINLRSKFLIRFNPLNQRNPCSIHINMETKCVYFRKHKLSTTNNKIEPENNIANIFCL
jgi:hypothetical protein